MQYNGIFHKIYQNLTIASFLGVLLVHAFWPSALQEWQPQWLTYLVIYLAISLEVRLDVGQAWCWGIFYDAALENPLGVHAISFVLIVVLINTFRARLRLFTYGKQWTLITLLLALDQAITVFAYVNAGQPLSLNMLYPWLISSLLWPLFQLFF